MSAVPYRSRSWSDEEREEVKALLAKGASAGVVANAMGCNRNQAIGRIHRDPALQLNAYASKALKKLRPRKAKPLRAIDDTSQVLRDVVKKTITAARLVCVATDPAPAESVPAEPEYLKTKALADTGAHFCKWPLTWDTSVIGHWICCGEPTTDLDSFCPYHRYQSKRRKLNG